MSELISGKEARLAWANGEELELAHATIREWEGLTDNYMLSAFDNGSYVFRLKPQTIKLTIEVPKPFEPKILEPYWALHHNKHGYKKFYANNPEPIPLTGAWRTEDEIKQVVAELRKLKGE